MENILNISYKKQRNYGIGTALVSFTLAIELEKSALLS